MSVSRPGFTRRKSDIGTTPSRLIPEGQGTVVNKGVQIIASIGNDATLYVGYSDALTADSADATDGFPLSPGAAIFVPCRHPSDVFIRSASGSNQKVWFIAQ